VLSWSIPERSIALIACINDPININIKNCLFPPPGQNPSTSKGGGKTKTSAYWDLVKAFLVQFIEYREAIQWIINTPKAVKERGQWTKKMKNRIDKSVVCPN
jgi:hypothetical protein